MTETIDCGASVDDIFHLCLGYTCTCGDRVIVFELPMNTGRQLAVSAKTVSCRNGHSRTVTLDQLGSLDHWVEGDDRILSMAV